MLNDYFEILVDTVFRHEGTVDKFIGDGMMVIWGAPLAHPDDPCRAVSAALEIHELLEDFNYTRVSRGACPILIGIGINTGEVVAGYIGSTRTMSYSVVGDSVNIASRLCSAARPGEIIISEYTHHIVGDHFHTKERPAVHAKGKRNPIRAYAVLGDKSSDKKSIYKGIQPLKTVRERQTG